MLHCGSCAQPSSAYPFDISIFLVITYFPMNPSTVISALRALAHEHRLAVYRLLIEQGSKGLPAGVIAERIGLAPSTLTFHLQQLTHAGLLEQTRASRQIIYAADFGTMSSLVGYLTENCCAGSGESCSAVADRPAAPSPRARQSAKQRRRPARVRAASRG